MLSSPIRGKDPNTPHLPKEPKPNDPILQGTFFHILIHLFSILTIKTNSFYHNPNIQNEITSLSLTNSHFHEENPSLWTILEPLYYSSYAMLV